MASTPLLRFSFSHHHHHGHCAQTTVSNHALKTPTIAAAPLRRAASTSLGRIKISASYNPATPAVDRLISAAAYTLPFLNSIHYGHHLFATFPPLAAALDPILPILSLYRSIPYASFVVFFALYLAVVRNPNFSYYARFNAMQALVLDILLSLPLLLARILSPGRTGPVAQLVAAGHSLLFVFVAICFVYGLASSVLGRTPHLPFVADAASRQL